MSSVAVRHENALKVWGKSAHAGLGEAFEQSHEVCYAELIWHKGLASDRPV